MSHCINSDNNFVSHFRRICDQLDCCGWESVSLVPEAWLQAVGCFQSRILEAQLRLDSSLLQWVGVGGAVFCVRCFSSLPGLCLLLASRAPFVLWQPKASLDVVIYLPVENHCARMVADCQPALPSGDECVQIYQTWHGSSSDIIIKEEGIAMVCS